MSSRYLAGLIIVAVCGFGLGTVPAASAAKSSSADSAQVLQLYFQIQKLKDRIRHMQGEIQTLKHQVAQNRELQKKNYQSLIKRRKGAEASGGSSSSAQSGARTQATKTAEGGSKTSQQPVGSPSNPSSEQSSEGGKQSQSSGNSLHEQYMAAFDILKKGEYDKAATAFQRFAQKHPHTGLTDNAYYWRGEALYVQQEYESARKAFVQVVNNFPKSAKVSDALYKLAVIDIRSGQQDNAKAILNRIIDQYSDSRAARLAKKKLEQLGS